MIVSNCIISIILGNQLAANEKAVRELIDTYPIYMAFQLMIYAPITEELVFRKSIKNITSINIFISFYQDLSLVDCMLYHPLVLL